MAAASGIWPFRRRTRRPEAQPPEGPDTDQAAETANGRSVRILLGLASGIVILFGFHAIAGILAPSLLALVLVICAQPVRVWLERHGTPSGVATGAVALTTFALLAGFVALLIIAMAQFVGMLPQYKAQFQQLGQQFANWLSSIGISPQDLKVVTQGFDPTKLLNFFSGLLGGAFGLITFGVIVLTMLILMPADAAYTPTLLRQLEPTKPNLVYAMTGFAHSVRRYMVVTTLLGIVQGVINGIALWILGVPAALLWAILSFLCSFIPNVGYFLALVPPLVFGYLIGGWGTVIAIIVIYGIVNAVVQSVVQPKVVGNAVALSQTLTFFSVLLWAVVLGAIGAILAIPLTLLARAILVDSDPRARIWRAAIGDLRETKDLMKEESDAAKAERREAKAIARSGGAGGPQPPAGAGGADGTTGTT
ncbi:AI-2E family transporter [Leifsonia shinshuensis]|uniref:Putative PurR-regulated permease PerM n=1 Tax=Leifsonia shinshuensis TaxID=150026 RepID=A0A853CWH5_9MICO|nr:AI-2E family transporter [Leifsonia shinshuensis]NYJ24812.1 putative PurR-regulated permease PerM [Leifsonia shinshuensis]